MFQERVKRYAEILTLSGLGAASKDQILLGEKTAPSMKTDYRVTIKLSEFLLRDQISQELHWHGIENAEELQFFRSVKMQAIGEH